MKSNSFLNGFKRFSMVKNYGMKKNLIKLTQKHGRYLKTHFATARGEAEIALQLIFQYPLGHFLFRGSRTKISVVMDSGRVDGQNKIGPEEFQHHDLIDPPCVPSLLPTNLQTNRVLNQIQYHLISNLFVFQVARLNSLFWHTHLYEWLTIHTCKCLTSDIAVHPLWETNYSRRTMA